MATKKPAEPIKMKIKKGDEVVIITGKDKGERGKVVQVLPKANRVLVEGRNMATKHVKPRQQGGTGSRVQRAMPLHASNVMLIDPHSGKPTRVGRKEQSGKVVRFAKVSNEVIDTE